MGFFFLLGLPRSVNLAILEDIFTDLRGLFTDLERPDLERPDLIRLCLYKVFFVRQINHVYVTQ